MSLLDSVTTELDDADAAIVTMRAALAAVDYAIGVDALSTSTPQATRSARQALRTSIAQAIEAAVAARALVAAQALAADPAATGYAAAVENVRTALAADGALHTVAVNAVQTAVEAALSDEVGSPVAFADVRVAATAAEAALAVDTTDVDAKALLEDAAEASLKDAIVEFRAGNAAVGTLATNAVATATRLGSLLALAQSALAAERPWQAAIYLADAKALQEALLAGVDLDAPGYDADNAAADPSTAWTSRAAAVLDAIATWSTPLADWAAAETARIDAADRLARFEDERVVRLARETEDALTP